jgi:hypothetical protein
MLFGCKSMVIAHVIQKRLHLLHTTSALGAAAMAREHFARFLGAVQASLVHIPFPDSIAVADIHGAGQLRHCEALATDSAG